MELFEAARAAGCPVAHSDEHDGFHLLLAYDDVRASMADHGLFSSEPRISRPILPGKSLPALEMDPPRHEEWRRLFSHRSRRESRSRRGCRRGSRHNLNRDRLLRCRLLLHGLRPGTYGGCADGQRCGCSDDAVAGYRSQQTGQIRHDAKRIPTPAPGEAS